MAWKAGRLVTARIRSDKRVRATLRYCEATRAVDLKPGQTLVWDGQTDTGGQTGLDVRLARRGRPRSASSSR